MASLSLRWKQEGNGHYQKVKPGQAPILTESHLKEAIKCYYKAATNAENNDEKSSAQKNYAMSSFKLAQCLLEKRDGTLSLVTLNYMEAMKYFCDAQKSGYGTKSQDWVFGLQTMSLQCWISIQDTLVETDEIEKRIKLYETYTRFIIGHDNRVIAYNELVELFLHLAVKKVIAKDYKPALSLLKDCYYPITEGLTLSSTEAIKSKTEALQEDVLVQNCIAEALQAMDTADDLFSSTISDEEELNIEMIWEIIDWYRRAIDLTRDKDIELEAIAHGKIGVVYEKVLQSKDRAKQYYTKCIELANTLVPRDVYQQDWYRSATNCLAKFQQEDLLNEEERNRSERKEIMTEIQEELEEIQQKFAKKGKADFLRYIYETFPPKNKKHVLATIPKKPEYTILKKLYQKAVVHYHPDKVDVGEHGKKWKVLSEEIVKNLTKHYEFFKGCD